MAASDYLNETLFHGTAYPFEVGDEVTPPNSRGLHLSEERKTLNDGDYSYGTTSLRDASRFARMRAGQKIGGEARIYLVQPQGELESNGKHFGIDTGEPTNFRSRTPLRVVGLYKELDTDPWSQENKATLYEG